MNVSQSEFDNLVSSQTRLLKLNLLQKISQDELKQIAASLRNLDWSRSPTDLVIVEELADAMITDALEVYIGLDTGFRTGDYTAQFWGVFDEHDDVTRLFVTRNTADLAGTILHTYMSSRRCARTKCFEAEYALADSLGKITDLTPLPPRMLQDIDLLTPNEMLILLQGITIAGSRSQIVTKVRQRCEYQLIDVSSSAQLKSLNTIAYLRGDITVEDLVGKRIQWYRQNKIAQLPRVEHAIELFKAVDVAVDNMLRNRLRGQSCALVSTLDETIQPGKIDVRADILALSIFCAFRRFAYEEIYIEATDRCPLFNPQPDQMAVFAEMFGLGSHCEAYLDVTPKALGKILFDKYRAYYNKHQPPNEADSRTTLTTAYASAGTDIDRDRVTDSQKGFAAKLKNTSYLGVYAVPALVDILLLTTIGRGLYISAFMSLTEERMATYAFVFALLLCGAVSNAISRGGSFYLYAMVYPTMNTFMITRLIGGVALVSIIAVIALIIIGVLAGIYAAAIFVLYLVALTLYLCNLAVMAGLQFPGTPLPSVQNSQAFF
jgi:hypothetical protein